MEVRTTAVPGVLLVKPQQFKDSRDYFVESYNQRAFAKAGTIRGLHFQVPPAAPLSFRWADWGRAYFLFLEP